MLTFHLSAFWINEGNLRDELKEFQQKHLAGCTLVTAIGIGGQILYWPKTALDNESKG